MDSTAPKVVPLYLLIQVVGVGCCLSHHRVLVMMAGESLARSLTGLFELVLLLQDHPYHYCSLIFLNEPSLALALQIMSFHLPFSWRLPHHL